MIVDAFFFFMLFLGGVWLFGHKNIRGILVFGYEPLILNSSAVSRMVVFVFVIVLVFYDMLDATPIEPARAVSTAIRMTETVVNTPQSPDIAGHSVHTRYESNARQSRKRHSFGKINLPSSQAELLSLRPK